MYKVPFHVRVVQFHKFWNLENCNVSRSTVLRNLPPTEPSSQKIYLNFLVLYVHTRDAGPGNTFIRDTDHLKWTCSLSFPLNRTNTSMCIINTSHSRKYMNLIIQLMALTPASHCSQLEYLEIKRFISNPFKYSGDKLVATDAERNMQSVNILWDCLNITQSSVLCVNFLK